MYDKTNDLDRLHSSDKLHFDTHLIWMNIKTIFKRERKNSLNTFHNPMFDFHLFLLIDP
jgi:hypothetical protein